MKQDQFLEILDRDAAEARWREVLAVAPIGKYSVAKAMGSAARVRSPVVLISG